MDPLEEVKRHHNRINDQGESLIKGSIPWLIAEMMENLNRIEDLMSPKHDRLSKKALRLVLLDIKDQLRELRRRFD